MNTKKIYLLRNINIYKVTKMKQNLEQLREYLRHNGYTQEMIADKIGTSKAYVNHLLTGRKAFGRNTAAKWSNLFGISYTWLLTGEGDMLNDDNNNIKYACAGVPYYNVDFTLGFDLVFNDQTTQPDYYVDFPPYNRCDAWINARGDSMSPTISSGDMVALQKVEDYRYLISGEIYAVVTKNGLRTIKRVNDMGNTLKLIPDNKAYEEQVIPKEELLAVFYVKGNVKAY